MGRRERGRAIPAVARTSEKRKTERGKDGRDPDSSCRDRGGGEGRGGRRERTRAPHRRTHHILLSRLPTLTAEAPFDEERHVGECLRREPAREEKSATHDDTRRANTREATRRVRIRPRARAGARGVRQEDCRRPRESVWQRWCPYPHQTAHHVDLDPPTRLADGKPSRKNRPPFRGRKRTTATTLPPPTTTTTVSGEREFSRRSRFSRHRTTTTSAILSLLYPPAPSALCTPPTTRRSTVISRNLVGNLQGVASRSFATKKDTRRKQKRAVLVAFRMNVEQKLFSPVTIVSKCMYR